MCRGQADAIEPKDVGYAAKTHPRRNAVRQVNDFGVGERCMGALPEGLVGGEDLGFLGKAFREFQSDPLTLGKERAAAPALDTRIERLVRGRAVCGDETLRRLAADRKGPFRIARRAEVLDRKSVV